MTTFTLALAAYLAISALGGFALARSYEGKYHEYRDDHALPQQKDDSLCLKKFALRAK